jgi:hypothetical protein
MSDAESRSLADCDFLVRCEAAFQNRERSGIREPRCFFFSLLPSKSKKLFVFPISIILANVDDELEGNRVVAIN